MKLSGLEVEYAVALIYSQESGKREATIEFDVGAGTQDIGFRGEVPVLFDIQPALATRLAIRDFDGEPTVGSTIEVVLRGREDDLLLLSLARSTAAVIATRLSAVIAPTAVTSQFLLEGCGLEGHPFGDVIALRLPAGLIAVIASTVIVISAVSVIRHLKFVGVCVCGNQSCSLTAQLPHSILCNCRINLRCLLKT